MSKPLFAQRPDMSVHPIGTFLPYPHAGLRCVHGETFDAIQLIKNEHRSLPAVHVVRRSNTSRCHGVRHVGPNARRMGCEAPLVHLGWRDDESRPTESHFLAPLGAGGLRFAGIGFQRTVVAHRERCHSKSHRTVYNENRKDAGTVQMLRERLPNYAVHTDCRHVVSDFLKIFLSAGGS